MACLKNNGYELARMEKIDRQVDEITDQEEKWVRTISIRSNGYILKKFNVTVIETNKKMNFPWKRYRKLKKNFNLDTVKDVFSKSGYQLI